MTIFKNKFSRKLISIIVCIALLMSYLPIMLTASAAENDFYNRVVDANTMDGWRDYFDLREGYLDTSNAGGIWTDKSVFTDASVFPDSIQMINDDENFLTALSAIAANKEIVGYSTVPTDTVFILDLSNSMSEDSVEDLVEATNEAIRDLQQMNNNNRVGVVLYSGSSSNRTYDNSVARLMPIDRYTTTNQNGDFIEYTNDGDVRLVRGRLNGVLVSGSNGSVVSESKAHSGATYIQAGLWEAWEMFNAVDDNDIVIGQGNWQEGESRMPIVVLMSDGAPTLGTSYFDNVASSTYGYGNQNATKSNVGNGNDTGITEGQGFLVQLTASYIKNRIENKYKVHEENGAGRSLFYTLGFNINSIAGNARGVATSVLNPDSTTATDSLWNTYNNLTANNNTMQVRVKDRSTGNRPEYMNVTVTKSSYATSKSYVDEYFSASGTGLTDAFNDIVDEIVLQSRYYPTHLEGGSPDFSGYVEFTDELGEYMEVKHINGILLGDTLFNGRMMASKLADNSDSGLGTPENPTELGDEFVGSVKTRLGIADTATAQKLVSDAYQAGQLKYVDENDWSNYIAWFADASGAFVGHWNESPTQEVPANAVYKIKSFGFLGETTGSIKNSDMMYMTVQVRESIATGKQTVSWKIPASLVSMITYLVEVDGTSIDEATNVRLSVEDKNVAPIRLVYETGLRSDLNEFNITKITDAAHIAADGHTRIFWNNYFDISAAEHESHKTAMSEFTPNKENERFYFTFDSAVHKKVGNDFEIVQNESLNVNGEYYHRRYVFKSGDTNPVFLYEKMSAASIQAAIDNGYESNFESLDHNTVGAWVVPKGTPASELQMYSKLKADEDLTKSAHMVFYPFLSEQNNIVYVDMNLGNNGLLSVTPATGIKISKTVDIFEDGTSDTFKFRLSIAANGSFDSWITDLDVTPEGEATVARITNGVYEFELKRDQTFWISGIPAGTAYTVEEISDNNDYKIKSVHVNNTAAGNIAAGTVSQYLVDDVDFVNTAVGEGDLVIAKQVVDANGNTVNVNDNIEFTINVALTNAAGDPVSGTFAATGGNLTVPSNGRFTVTLSDGESFIVHGIPEKTNYTVTETNIPSGFSLDTDRSTLVGVVDASANDQALVVNTYAPTATDGDEVSVEVTKTISGNRTTWQNSESYTFKLDRLDITRAATTLATKTISYSDSIKKVTFSLADETYAAAGTYYYRLTEVVGTQGGITYDTAERRFAVVVADSDMDGDLEITEVRNEVNTSVSGRWVVSANFNNAYAPTGAATATINVQKAINDGHSLAGFQFALYSDSGLEEEVLRSNITGTDGKAVFNINYAANLATMEGAVYTYYLAEIAGDNPNITYSDTVYTVNVTVKDNGDGTVSATPAIVGQSGNTVTFTNIYTLSASDYVTFAGKKTIPTANRVLNAGEFKFNITAVDNAPLPAVTTVSNAADGSFAFGAIEFDTVGTYKYIISEDDTKRIGGFAYDTKDYYITVEVVDNNDATLTAAITSVRRGESEADSQPATDIVFENNYYTIATTLQISGTKLLTGKVMQVGEFEFEMKAVTAGAPLPPGGTVVVNEENGSFAFTAITFTNPGTYVYTITEVEGGDTRYTYDKAVYTITVVVTDNSEGRLLRTYTMTKNGNASGEVVFSNNFVPTPITYDIYDEFGGNKVLEGRPIEDGEFEFRLINAINGQQIGETVKNDADGVFKFPAVTLPLAGTYHYKITEVIGDENGITYDTDQYHIVLGVTQDENGLLSITREELHVGKLIVEEVGGVPTERTEYTDITEDGAIAFVNSYEAAPSEIKLGGRKFLTGRALEEGEFTFNLYHATFNDETGKWEKGELVEQTTNSDDGNFAFENRISEESAQYIYFITEDATDPDPTITYDTKEYIVVVTSTDNLDGTRTLSYEYKVGEEAVDDVLFTNNYTAPPAPPVIPETGDTNNTLWLWTAVAFISALGIFTTGFFTLRKSEEK